MSFKVAFFGTPDFAAAALDTLLTIEGITVPFCVTQPPRPAGRGKKLLRSPVGELAIARDIALFEPHSLRKEWPVLHKSFAAFGEVDLFLVAAFGQILPRDVLTFPRAGCLNIHASLLPRWRGAAPIHRAIEAGDTKSGVCLMDMEEGLDTGAVYTHLECSIDERETTGTLHDKLIQLSQSLLRSHLKAIIRGEISPVPQPEQGVTYADKFRKEEAQLNFSLTALDNDRKIRASNPYPCAYCSFNGKRLKVIEAKVSTNSTIETMPGRAWVDQNKLFVCCSSGCLELLKVQLEGAKIMSSNDFIRGHSDLFPTVLTQIAHPQ